MENVIDCSSPSEFTVPIVFKSHGVKKSPPEYAHFYVDARCVRDPSSVAGLGGNSGDSPNVQEWIAKAAPEAVAAAIEQVKQAIRMIPFRRMGKKDVWEDPFEVCFLCAHGIHRSRSLKWIVANALLAEGYNVSVK